MTLPSSDWVSVSERRVSPLSCSRFLDFGCICTLP
jgi:hypothetical protein